MLSTLLNRQLAVSRRVAAQDGMGGETSTWQPAGSVWASVAQPAPKEEQEAAAFESTQAFRIYLEPGEDVRRGDRLEDATRGQAFRVHAVLTNSRETYSKALCELEQGEGERQPWPA